MATPYDGVSLQLTTGVAAMAKPAQTLGLMSSQPLDQPATGRRRMFLNKPCRDLYRMVKGLDVGTKTEGSELARRYEAALESVESEQYREVIRRRTRRFLRQFIEDTKVSEGAS